MSPKTLLKKHHLDKHVVRLMASTPAQESPNDLLDSDQVAEWLMVHPNTLRVWRMAKNSGPPFVKLSAKNVRYRRADVGKWLESRKRS